VERSFSRDVAAFGQRDIFVFRVSGGPPQEASPTTYAVKRTDTNVCPTEALEDFDRSFGEFEEWVCRKGTEFGWPRAG